MCCNSANTRVAIWDILAYTVQLLGGKKNQLIDGQLTETNVKSFKPSEENNGVF